MKYIILVGDGMGDYPLAELDNKTPLGYVKDSWSDVICAGD